MSIGLMVYQLISFLSSLIANNKETTLLENETIPSHTVETFKHFTFVVETNLDDNMPETHSFYIPPSLEIKHSCYTNGLMQLVYYAGLGGHFETIKLFDSINGKQIHRCSIYVQPTTCNNHVSKENTFLTEDGKYSIKYIPNKDAIGIEINTVNGELLYSNTIHYV